MRIALPAIALVLIGVFIANTGGNADDNFFLDEFADVNATSEELRMAKPHFSGVDDDGTPFDITADAAIQTPGDDKTVKLENPKAVSAADGKRSVISARRGAFDSDQKILNLEDNVLFDHTIGEDGYTLTTPTATFSVDDETITSTEGVAGQGPRGATLKADKMFADNKTGKVVFEGNVHTTIYPSRERAKCAENDATSDNDANDQCGAPTNLGDRLK